MQEIQLAKDAVLRCGHDEVAWVEFCRAILALWGKLSLDLAISRRRLGSIEKLVNPITSTNTIHHILHRIDDRGCSNKRHSVYGVMGLFSETFRARIQPQYFFGVGEVYRDFVCSHIQHVKRLELLRGCQLEGRTVDAPSWVPDFSISKFTVKSVDWQFASGYSACEVSFATKEEWWSVGYIAAKLAYPGGYQTTVPNVAKASRYRIQGYKGNIRMDQAEGFSRQYVVACFRSNNYGQLLEIQIP